MTQEADLIVVGRCLNTRSEWMGKVLVTVATLEVTETLKGSAKKTISVVLPGGVDTKRKVPVVMTYAGAPTLRPNENVFLFLNQDAALDNALTVAGFSQGKYNVVADPTGAKLVTRNMSDIRFVGGRGMSEGSRERRTLGEFRDEIRGYISATNNDVEK